MPSPGSTEFDFLYQDQPLEEEDEFGFLYESAPEEEEEGPVIVEDVNLMQQESPLEALPEPTPTQSTPIAPEQPATQTFDPTPLPPEAQAQMSMPDQDVFVDQSKPLEKTQTGFFLSGGKQIPTEQMSLSADATRNSALNALLRENLTPDVRRDLRIQYARMLANEGHAPERSRPQNERMVERLRDLAEKTSKSQEGLKATRKTDNEKGSYRRGRLPSGRKIGSKEDIYDTVARETSTFLFDRSFSKPFTPTPKQYVNLLASEELMQLAASDRKAILKLVPAYSQEASELSEEDLIYDTGQATGLVTKLVGGASNIVTGMAAIPFGIGAAALAGDTTITGEAVDDDVNNGAIYSAVESFLKYRKDSPGLDPSEVVFNVVQGQPASQTYLNRLPEISLRSERIGSNYRIPKNLSSDVAKVMTKLEDEEFEKEAKQIISDSLGPYTSEASVKIYFDKIKAGLFFRGSLEDNVPLDESQDFAIQGPSVKRMADLVRSKLMPGETEGEKLSGEIEKAYDFYNGFQQEARADATGMLPFVANESVDELLFEGKDIGGRSEFLTITGGIDPRNLSPAKMEEFVHRYVSKREFSTLIESAKNGDLGDEWAGKDVSKDLANLRHQVAAHVAMLYKEKNNPEFNSVLAEYGDNFAEAILATPEEMLLSLVGVPGMEKFFSEDQVKRAKAKWENEPLFAALDLAFFTSMFARLGKAGVMSATALNKAFKGVKKGDYTGVRSAFSAEKTKLKTQVDDVVSASTDDRYADVDLGEVGDLPGVSLFVSDETSTIVYSEKEAARLRKKAQDSTDPAEVESSNKAAEAYEKNAEVAKTYYDEGLPSTEEGMPKVTFVEETPGVANRSKQTTSSKRVSTFNEEGRTKDFERTSERTLKAREDLYKRNPDQKIRDNEYGSKVVERFAKSRNLKDPLSNPGGLVRLLIGEGVTDSRVYQFIVENSKVPIEAPRDVIVQLTTMGRNKAYKLGLESRTKTIAEILDDGPVGILSKETKENPAYIRSRLDSLKIAEELREAGESNPYAYSGLSLTDKEIAEFAKGGERVRVKTPSVKRKITEQEYLLDSNGTFIGEKVVDSARGPKRVYGFEGSDLRPGVPLLRVMGKWLVGDKATAMFAQAGRGGVGNGLFFTALGTMEYMRNPFAFVHLPKLYRESVTESLNYYYSTGKKQKWLEVLLTGLVKPSKEIGTDTYAKIVRQMTEAGMSRNEIIEYINSLPDQLTDQFVTRAQVEKTLGIDAAKGYVETTIPAANHSDFMVNMHKSMDVDIDIPKSEVRTSRGESVPATMKASDFIALEVDVTKKLLREIEEFQAEITRLTSPETFDYDFHLTHTGKKAIRDLESEIFVRTERIKNGSGPNGVYEDVNTVYSSRDRVSNRQALSEVGELRGRVTKPYNELTSYEKAVAVVFQEQVIPAKQKVFNKVAQLIAGNDTQKLILSSSIAPKGTILKKIVHNDLSAEYRVVKTFEDTAAGNAQAAAYKEALGKTSGSKTTAQKKTEAATGSTTEYILANQDEVSFRLLYGDGYDQMAVRRPSASFPTEELIPSLANYLSVYVSKDGLSNLIKKTLDDITSGKISPAEQLQSIEYLQRQMLFGVSGGAELLKKHGGDIKKTWDEILNMTDVDQNKLLGRALTPQERFFHTQAFGSSFEPKQLLDMYTNYQYALQQTLLGLDQNITMLKLQNMLRNRGQILTKAEHNALKRRGDPMANSFIDPGKVKPRIRLELSKDAPIFGNSFNGFVMSKGAANYFAKQAGLNQVQRSLANKTFQWFKFAKILDVFGGALMRNGLSTVFFHGYGAGPTPVNWKYVKAFREDYKRFQKGEPLKDPRHEQVIRQGIGTGSRKIELTGSTNLLDSFEELMVDILDSAGDSKALIDSIKGTKSTKEINRLVDILSLKGFEKRTNTFLNNFKLADSGASRRIPALQEAEAAKSGVRKAAETAAEETGNFGFDRTLETYSIFDEYAKGGYTVQLMDEMKLPRAKAFGISSDTFVDYFDMSTLFNTFRYASGSGAGAGLFLGAGVFGMPFVSYSANGFYLGANMLSKNTVRSWIAAHMMRSQDDALEETLKLNMTVDQYRDALQNPTLTLLPYQYATKSKPGSYMGPKKDFEEQVGGIASITTENISSVSFISPKRLAEQKAATEDFGWPDVVSAAFMSIGGPFADIVRNTQKTQSASLRKKHADAFIEIFGEDGTKATNLPEADIKKLKEAVDFKNLRGSMDSVEKATDTALKIVTPTVISSILKVMSAASDGDTILGKQSSPVEAGSKFMGLAIVPASLRAVVTSKITDADKAAKYSALVSALSAINAATDGLDKRTVDYFLKQEANVHKDMRSLKAEMEKIKDPIAIEALKELELIEFTLIGDWLSGKITEESYRRSMTKLEY